ncbi:uncharacterized protein si:ch211-130h14.4 isoform X2 [Polypterus senegalus]|uniref:uncharacterized protein si:ch211-130h14.4 isoform X2 n=1 Tax=Polypterus senegalus TaxID=55291 RepID=UPI0019666154|nr:uncharacterized protein si:ch211-130h14.4 isoform X2 [Polypterus senegalus]
MASINEIHQKSSLPSILDTYLPLSYKGQNKLEIQKRNEERKETKLTKITKIYDEDEEERRMIKQSLLDQHHLEVYRNMYRLRDALYLHYMDLLKQKIHKQRYQIKQRSNEMHKQTERPKKQMSPVHKLPYNKISHDDRYLQSLPKSGYYLIVEVQNQLTRCGYLKTRRDFEEFWHLISQFQHSSHLKERLQEMKLMMNGCKTTLMFQNLQTNDTVRSLQNTISVTQKNGLQSTHFREQRKYKPSLNSLSEDPACEHIAHLSSKHQREQDRIEQMFPKLQIPKFFCFQEDLKKQYRTPDVGLVSKSLHTCTSTEREESQRKLHHMYNVSFTNMASSKRLLDRNGQFTSFEDECSVRSLIPCFSPVESKLSKFRRDHSGNETFSMLSPQDSTEDVTPNRNTILKCDSSKETVPSKSLSSCNPAVPLTMEDICRTYPVLVGILVSSTTHNMIIFAFLLTSFITRLAKT